MSITLFDSPSVKFNERISLFCYDDTSMYIFYTGKNPGNCLPFVKEPKTAEQQKKRCKIIKTKYHTLTKFQSLSVFMPFLP